MTGSHAVVAGASMAGLLAARVLTDHVDRVTVVEPDPAWPGPVHRRGVPQSRHGHLLLARGAEVVEQLLPGLLAELVADGAARVPSVIASDRGLRFVGAAGPFAEVTDPPSTVTNVGVSRVLLEHHVRRRVAALPGVTIEHGCRVVDLVATPENRRIVGALVGPSGPGPDRSGSTGRTSTRMVPADLVVDASGRRSSLPRWLTGLGYPSPAETVVDSGIGYATRWYRRPDRPTAGWDATIVNARPGVNPRVGALLPVENGECTVTMAGFAGHHPPVDDEGFLQWARDLPDPQLHEAIGESTPVSAIHAYRTPTTRLRHLERMARWPRGLLVTGDAVCAFNPIFGQGMTVSALDALALEAALRDPAGDLEREFRQRVARVVAAPWLIASSEDLRWDVPVHGAGRGRFDGLRDRYLTAVNTAATADPAVAKALFGVASLTSPLGTLTRPSVAWRVLRNHLGRGSAAVRSGHQPVPDREDHASDQVLRVGPSAVRPGDHE